MRILLALIVLFCLAACQAPAGLSARMDLSQTSLVDLSVFAPEIGIDLRYRLTDNIAQRPLYHAKFPALLHRDTAKRLRHANRLLKKSGLRLVVWDAFRPHDTQIALWEASGHDDRYVANPYRNPSLHSHGCAVDVTLQYLDGRMAVVPTKFDDFSARAASDFVHSDPEVKENMRLLKEAMWAAGFGTLPHEWWHFMDKDYKTLPFIPTSTLPHELQTMIRSSS
jgi:D-alanyl-D-alanine dipeptidase